MSESTQPQPANPEIQAAAPPAPAPATADFNLEHPIPRPGEALGKIVLRKPKGGDLRGLKITDLMNGDASAVIALLPRISMPFITEQEAAGLEAEDICEAAGIIVGFFMTKAQKEMVATLMGG